MERSPRWIFLIRNILRKHNSRDGEILVGRQSTTNPLIHLLNTKTNIGENAFIFRYRLSSQLLMSSRGAFIEKVRGRDGRITALNLLPPQHTSPIPHPTTFVSGYEVAMPTGEKIILKPNDKCMIMEGSAMGKPGLVDFIS